MIEECTKERIRSLHAVGASLQTIAAVLNQEPVTWPNGKRWSSASGALLYSTGAASAAEHADFMVSLR